MTRTRGRLTGQVARLTALALAVVALGPTTASAAGAEEPERVKVPVVLSVDHAVAGVEVEIGHTDGLTFIGLELSDTTDSASLAPVVNKDGNVHFGFYSMENSYAPQDGTLSLGSMVFSYDGSAGQTVTLKKVKWVQVIDAQTTDSETVVMDETIRVPEGASDGFRVGEAEERFPLRWVGLALVLVLAAAAATVVLRKRKTRHEAARSS